MPSSSFLLEGYTALLPPLKGETMTDSQAKLPPELEEQLKAHWSQQEDAKEQAKSLTWHSFLDWLKGQSDLLGKNPGLMEQIVQIGPALMNHLLRILT
jgi:hypothetical protein